MAEGPPSPRTGHTPDLSLPSDPLDPAASPEPATRADCPVFGPATQGVRRGWDVARALPLARHLWPLLVVGTFLVLFTAS